MLTDMIVTATEMDNLITFDQSAPGEDSDVITETTPRGCGREEVQDLSLD